MENKNEKIPQELDLEQMEEVSGGEGGPVTRCDICGATFTDYRKYLAHRMECNPVPKKFVRPDIPR